MVNTVDDLLKGRDFREFYQGLSPEKQLEVERRVVDIGHDRGVCRDFRINYARPDITQLRAAACYELGIIGRQ